MKRDYYEILGVDRNASAEEIRRAYRRLARSHHPDLHSSDPEAEARFKEINEAHEVLRNPETRAMYDRFGHAGVRTTSGGDAVYPDFGDFGDLGELFEQFLGFGTRTRTRGRPASERGADRRSRIRLTFEDAVFGAPHEVEVVRLEQCSECKGTGAKPGTKPLRCETCQGKGQVRTVQQSAFGAFVNVQTCPRCRGRGEVMPEVCRACGGDGRVRRERKLEVDIPAGVEDGTQIRLAGEGDAGKLGGPAGNLYVVLEVEDHPVFERQGNDLHLQLRLNAAEAALGTELEVPTIDSTQTIAVPPGAQTGDTIRLEGRGVPYLRRTGRGDEIVTVVVATPERLSPEQRQLYKELGATLPAAEVVERERGLWNRVKERFG